MQFIVLLLSIGLFLYGCGGGGTSDAPKPPPYTSVIHQPKQLTDGKHNKTGSVVVHGDGVNLVLWLDDRDNFNQLHGEDIWGAIVTPDGAVVKSFPVLKRSGRDIYPYATYDKENKRFAVVWISYAGGIGSSQVSSAIIDRNGNIVDLKDLPLSSWYADMPSIKSIPEGFVIAYKDISGGDFIGSKLGKMAVTDKDFNIKKIITFTEDTSYGIKTEPLSIAFDCDGKDNCFVAYGQEKQILKSDGLHIYGKFINIKTGEVGQEIRLTDEVYGKQAVSKTLADVIFGKDRYLVTWRDWDSTQGLTSTDLAGKIVLSPQNISGNILISDFRWDKKADIKTGLGGMVYYAKTAYSEATNRFHVVWVDSRSGIPLEPHLFLRRLAPDGTFIDKDCIKITNMGARTPWIAIGSNSIFITFAQSGVRKEHGLFTSEIWGVTLSQQLMQ